MGFICAKWIRLDDGCVARCDKDHTHQGRHLDSIIDICWPDNDPRMQANMPATTAAELVKRVQTRQFELARAIKQRNHAIAMESPYKAGQHHDPTCERVQLFAAAAAIEKDEKEECPSSE